MNLAEGLLLLEAKEIVYHGTSSKFGREILKKGFVPDPKQKASADEIKALGLFHGSYLAKDLTVSQFYARRASMKFGGKLLYVKAQIETRTATFDEDDLPALDRFLRLYPNSDEAAAAHWLDMIDNTLDRPLSQQEADKLRPRVLAYYKTWKSHQGAENHAAVRRAKGPVLKALKGIIARSNRRAYLVPEPINFRGANKIISMVMVDQHDDFRITTIYGPASLASEVKRDLYSGSFISPGSIKDLP